MSADAIPTSIKILDKEYVVSCPPGEEKALLESAAYLNERLRQAREGGKIHGSERIVVMTALNVAHEYLSLLRESESRATELGSGIRRLEDKISSSLSDLSAARASARGAE